jgi:hypothetical protein
LVVGADVNACYDVERYGKREDMMNNLYKGWDVGCSGQDGIQKPRVDCPAKVWLVETYMPTFI